MSLKKNIIISYAAQIYVSAVGILILPLYIKYMGAESYGLIGFFTMLQALFGLLDLGLTPTIGRETARYHGGTMTVLDYRKLLRSLHILFFTIATIGGVFLFFLAPIISVHWLKVTTISIDTVNYCVKIMAFSIALRWIGGLYRGIISGSERLDWLSYLNIFITTLRFIIIFPVMKVKGYTPFVFFTYQLIVAIIEYLSLLCLSTLLTPKLKSANEKIGFSFSPIMSLMRFSLTVAFTSSIWILITQSDKLILSGILELSEYGHFTLSVLLASGILMINIPVTNSILPRLARLHAENKHDELLRIYKNTTMLVCILGVSASLVVAIYAEPLLLIWTGDAEVSASASPILSLYAIGNGLLAVSAFPYYLQYAQGRLKYHFWGNIVMFFMLIPTIIVLARNFGGVGAGYAWLIVNVFYLFVWTALVHHKLIPGLHLSWLMSIGMITIPTGIIVFFLSFIVRFSGNRLHDIIVLGLISILALMVSIVSCWLIKRMNLGV